jgi:hypothetical protein
MRIVPESATRWHLTFAAYEKATGTVPEPVLSLARSLSPTA